MDKRAAPSKGGPDKGGSEDFDLDPLVGEITGEIIVDEEHPENSSVPEASLKTYEGKLKEWASGSAAAKGKVFLHLALAGARLRSEGLSAAATQFFMLAHLGLSKAEIDRVCQDEDGPAGDAEPAKKQSKAKKGKKS